MTDNVNTVVDNTVVEAPAVSTPVIDNAVKQETTITDWKDSLPEKLKTAKSIQTLKSVEDLVQNYVERDIYIGKKVDDWSKADIEKFQQKMGKPVDASGYQLPDELGEAAIQLKNAAFKAGLSQDQLKALADEIIVDQRSINESAKAEAEKSDKAHLEILQKEFGTAFNERINLANIAAKQLGGQEFVDVLNSAGLGSNSVIIKTLEKIGREFLSPNKIVKSDEDATFGITPSQARARIDTMLADKGFREAYFNGSHPGHAKAVAERQMLESKLNSEG